MGWPQLGDCLGMGLVIKRMKRWAPHGGMAWKGRFGDPPGWVWVHGGPWEGSALRLLLRHVLQNKQVSLGFSEFCESSGSSCIQAA